MVTNTQLLIQRSHRESGEWGHLKRAGLPGGAAVAYLKLGMWAKCCQVFCIFKKMKYGFFFFLWETFWFSYVGTTQNLESPSASQSCIETGVVSRDTHLWFLGRWSSSSKVEISRPIRSFSRSKPPEITNFCECTFLGWDDSNFLRVKNPWPADF